MAGPSTGLRVLAGLSVSGAASARISKRPIEVLLENVRMTNLRCAANKFVSFQFGSIVYPSIHLSTYLPIYLRSYISTYPSPRFIQCTSFWRTCCGIFQFYDQPPAEALLRSPWITTSKTIFLKGTYSISKPSITPKTIRNWWSPTKTNHELDFIHYVSLKTRLFCIFFGVLLGDQNHNSSAAPLRWWSLGPAGQIFTRKKWDAPCEYDVSLYI